MSDDIPKCCIGLNPDITGIGVRVALYTQILLGWSTSCIWPDTFARNARTAYMTAIALIIAAIIQHTKGLPQNLSLLDGLVVSLITAMMITFTISSSPGQRSTVDQPNADGNNQVAAEENREPDPNASFSRFLTHFIFLGLWAGWCLHIWQDPMNFGFKHRLPNCDYNKYVVLILFGREINATDERMRSAALALVALGIFFAFASLWVTLEQLLDPLLNLFMAAPAAGQPTEPNTRDQIHLLARRILQAFSFATLIFLGVETELTIRRNDPKDSTSEWSYGQTIAVILLLQQIMDFFSTCLEKQAWAHTRAFIGGLFQRLRGQDDDDSTLDMPMQNLDANNPANAHSNDQMDNKP